MLIGCVVTLVGMNAHDWLISEVPSIMSNVCSLEFYTASDWLTVPWGDTFTTLGEFFKR